MGVDAYCDKVLQAHTNKPGHVGRIKTRAWDILRNDEAVWENLSQVAGVERELFYRRTSELSRAAVTRDRNRMRLDISSKTVYSCVR